MILRKSLIFPYNFFNKFIGILPLTLLYGILIGQSERPKIGLALSGGAVKGIAHIGVIKVLEEEGIIPDYITGTSIGAIVGGLYAMGYSADQLVNIAKNTSWSYYFNDDWNRTSIPLDRRQQMEKYLLKFEWSKDGISLPKSLVYGEKLSLLLSNLTLPGHSISNFDDFPIPFRCVATDIVNGEPVVFKDGDIAMAMRASMSLPSIFEPVTIDGRTYVDGGASRNFPIQDAIEMGADIVIAVDVEAGLLSIDNISSALDILDQTMSFRINDSSSKQRTLANIIIRPNLNGITGFSFNRVNDLLLMGEEAAKKALPKIKELVTNTKPLNNSSAIIKTNEYKISSISIESGQSNTNKVIKASLGVKENSMIELSRLEKNITRLYTTEWIRSLQYRLEHDGNQSYNLKIKAEPRPSTWVKIAANYDSDLKAGLGLGIFKRNVLINGALVRINLRISENPAGEFNYKVPLFNSQKSNLNFNSIVNFYPANAFVDGKLVNQFKIHHFQSSVNFVHNLGRNSIVSIGVGREQFTQNRKLYEPSKDEIRLTQTVLPLAWQYDSYDHAFFPNSGITMNFYSNFVLNGKLERIIENQTNTFSKINLLARANIQHVSSFSKKLKIINGIDAGVFDYEANNFINSFYLGRSLINEITHVPFTGLLYMGEPSTRFVALKSQIRYELKPNIFISGVGNYGATELTIGRRQSTRTLLGGGIELGYKSPLGPVKLTAEYGNIHKKVISYLHIGYYF
jgi:NTE family protein